MREVGYSGIICGQLAQTTDAAAHASSAGAARHRHTARRRGREEYSGRLLAIAIVAIAVLPFPSLATLLRFDREGRDRPGFQTLDANLLAGLQAVTVAAVLDPLERLVNLANQLALTVTGTQLQAEFLLLGRAIVRIREVRRFILHVRDGAIDLFHQVAFPREQDL